MSQDHKSKSVAGRKGLLERLAEGPVLCAEGYVFELERRGYISAGAYVPEVVLDFPEVVSQLHTEFVRAGDNGSQFKFRFCPVCGSTVYHTEEGHEDSVAVAVGAFADPTFPAPRVSIYQSRRHPWVELPAGTKTFEQDPG